MTTRPGTRRAHLLAATLWLAAGTAQALPSIDIIWRLSGTSQIGTPTVSASNTVVADIVLRANATEPAVTGVFISISFDPGELQATAGRELQLVNLPGMGNVFRPVFSGVTIDNTAGLVTGFDTAVSPLNAPGLASGSQTLGSIRFHILSLTESGDVDVIANLSNTGVDTIVTSEGESSATFNGASVDGPFFSDIDGDGRPDGFDNCPATANPGQENADGDFRGDVCDNCPTTLNLDQQDTSGNGTGDVCNDEDLDGLLDTAETLTGVFVDENDTGTDPLNPDTDGDGLPDGLEVLDYGSNPHASDSDADTVGDAQDNCVLVANTDQANADAGTDDDPTSAAIVDAFGDRCDADVDNDGVVNSADFFGYFRPCFDLFVSGNPQCASSDLDGSGRVDSADFFGYFRPQFGGAPGPGRRQLDPDRFFFTTCGQAGRSGPSQAQCDVTYAETSLEGAVAVSGGIQTWTVPSSGTYGIEAQGAQGAPGLLAGGGGARMSGELPLAAGDVLHILVGQSGIFGMPSFPGGGGGGSFVVAEPGTIPLMIAAGGGGASNPPLSTVPPVAGGPGRVETAGGDGSVNIPCGSSGEANTGGGENGNGGGAGCGGGGGGLYTDGAGPSSYAGRAYANGGTGGLFLGSDDDSYPHGGFGGGGAGSGSGGGGGGYSGGASSGSAFPPGEWGNGGGGGSFNAGTAQENTAGASSGPGRVTIMLLSTSATAAASVAEQPAASAQAGSGSTEPTGAAQGAGASGTAAGDGADGSLLATGACTGDGCQHTLAAAAAAVPTSSLFSRAMLVLAVVALSVAFRERNTARR